MKIFSKRKDEIAENTAEYVLGLLSQAISEYDKQEEKVLLFNSEKNNETYHYYERQYMTMVQKKVQEASSICKGIYGRNSEQISSLCNYLDECVESPTIDIYKKDTRTKLTDLQQAVEAY